MFQKLIKGLNRMAPIAPGEGAAVALCFLVFLLLNAGIIFGRNSAYSLFLVYFGVQYLPYMYFANAAFIILCSLVYTTLVDRFDRGRFLATVSAIFVAALILSRIVLARSPHWFYPILFMEAQVIWYFTLMQFWTFVGDLFDARQAKRLFPLLGIGGPVGMIAVWVVNGPLVRAFGAEGLLVMWAGAIAVGTALAGVTYRRYRPARQPAPRNSEGAMAGRRPSEWEKIKGGLSEVGREPLLRSTAAYILLLWTVYSVVDFCFNKTMRAHYPNPSDLATFFGFFFGLQGVVCLVIQSLLTRPVIERLGVGTTINFHPSFLLAGTGWMSVRYGYAPVFAAKLGDASMLYTFSDSSYQLLYNPIPPERRARVRGFIEGYIRPLSLAAAGLLVLLGNNYLHAFTLEGYRIGREQQLAWGAFAVAAVWLGFALTAKRGYISALLGNLHGPNLSLREAAQKALGQLRDASSIALLIGTLKSEQPARVLAAVGLLETFGSKEAADGIAQLLEHSDERVRSAAAGALGRLSQDRFSKALIPLLRDPDARVRANAVEALGGCGNPTLAPLIQPLLKDASARTQVNAMVAIALLEGRGSIPQFIPLIAELMRGGSGDRIKAVYALAHMPGDQSSAMLADLLHDPLLEIRIRAARALRDAGGAAVVPRLIEALAGPAELRQEVRRTLAAIARRSGSKSIESLISLAPGEPRVEIRSELADVLGRLDSPRVIGALITLLNDPEWRVRWKVLKAFGRLARTMPLPEDARIALLDYARQEIAAHRENAAFARALIAEPRGEADRLLAQTLRDDREKIEERVFRMLGIVCGYERMRTITQNLGSGDARLRADALEALDSLSPRPLARDLLAMLEPSPRDSSAHAIGADVALRRLASHSKAWIRASTAFFLSAHPSAEGERLLETLLNDPNRAVKETALYSGWLAFPGEWQPRVEFALRSEDEALRRVAERILRKAGEGPTVTPAERNHPMIEIEKVLFLRSAPIFSGLDSEELAALAEIAIERDYAPGENLFEEGEKAHHLYLLQQGKVEVRIRADSGEKVLAVLGENEVFGEMALLDDEPRSATVRAVEPTVILKVDRENFRELIMDRPQIALAILRVMSLRLRQHDAELEHPAEIRSLHATA